MVQAAQQFYTAQTLVPYQTPEGQLQQRYTLPLHSVSNPEEKRRIIGDTFMKVRGDCPSKGAELSEEAGGVELRDGIIYGL